MNKIINALRNCLVCDEGDRRPRALRRILPMSYATAEPLDGHQLARLHIAAYH